MKPGLAASVASLASRDELARPADTGSFTSRRIRWQISFTYFSGVVLRQTWRSIVVKSRKPSSIEMGTSMGEYSSSMWNISADSRRYSS